MVYRLLLLVFEALVSLSLDSTDITERSKVLLSHLPNLTSVRYGLQQPARTQRQDMDDMEEEE